MDADLGAELTRMVIGAAIEVHRELGPGLLETAYEHCLTCELQQRGIAYARQVQLPLIYKGTEIDCRYRIDLVIEDALIVEVKSVDRLTPMHDAQVLTYLRLSGYQLALLVNFNTVLLKQGIRRIALSSAWMLLWASFDGGPSALRWRGKNAFVLHSFVSSVAVNWLASSREYSARSPPRPPAPRPACRSCPQLWARVARRPRSYPAGDQPVAALDRRQRLLRLLP